MKLKLAIVVFVSVILWGIAFAPVEADDPVSTSVSFNREVIRIIQRKCEPCHAPGGLAMSLLEYQDVRAWGRAIREELVEHRMPPAIVARGYGRYESDPSLNAREMATFLAWLDGGMPRGDPADRPPASAAADAIEDLDGGAGVRLSLPPQNVPAREEVVVRRVTVDAGGAVGRAIARVQFRPGNRRVLRGAVVFATTNGKTLWIGGWSPWQHAVVPPAQYAFRLPVAATLVVELYYRGAESELTDQSSVDLTFAPETATGQIDDVVVEAREPAGTRMRGSVKLSQPATVWAIRPELLASMRSMELLAERPDKSAEVLLWIPKVRADWPLALVMQEPIGLPAGSTVSLVVETGAPDGHATRPRVTLSVLR
jgi:hypothetical protein